MGTLRTIFALAVVFAHSWPTGSMFVGSRNAVQLFYIISGFLISYVLVERKSYHDLPTFYLSRYLRLYPIYFFVAVLSLVLLMATRRPGFLEVYESAPNGAIALLAFANLFLFGQDWVMFSGVRDHTLVFVSDFKNSDVMLFQGLVVHQAWTLGVELSFYVIAPFVLPRRKCIYVLLILSLALRVYLISTGLGFKDPWTYRFFPTELAFFLLGALAHQLLLPLCQRVSQKRLGIAADVTTYTLIAISLSFTLIPVAELYKTICLFFVFLMFIPMAFIFQNRHRIDNWIGNLSYPIYIGHILVIRVSGFAMSRFGIIDQRVVTIIGALLAIVFAVFLNQFIAVPVDKIRQNLKVRASSRNEVPSERWKRRKAVSCDKSPP
jgi:peptidoglycan/LPS O-acetylase OafA/YrhL